MNEELVCSNNSHQKKKRGRERKKNQNDIKESISDSHILPSYLKF